MQGTLRYLGATGAALLFAAGLGAAPVRADGLPPYPALDVPFGVNRVFDYSEEQAELQRLDPPGVMAVIEGRDLQYVTELGIRHYRVQPNEYAGFAWDRMTGSAGGARPDFARTDALVATAQRSGLDVLPVLAPYRDPTVAAEAGRHYRPKDLDAYAAWVRAVVERYDGDGTDDMPGLRWAIGAWQVDVTPDKLVELGDGRFATVEDYIAVLDATATAVRAADANAQMVIGAISSAAPRDTGLQMLDAVLASPAGAGVDVLAFEYLPRALATAELRDAVRAMQERAGTRPIWCTLACSYSRYTPRNATRDRGADQTTQAADMVRRTTYLIGTGVARVYEAGVTEAGPDSWKDRTFYSGLREHDGAAKLAYSSYRLLVRLLGPVDPALTEILSDGENDLVVFQFGRPEDPRLLYILWWDYAATADYRAGRLEPDIATQLTLTMSDEKVEVGQMVQNTVGRFQTAVVATQDGQLILPVGRVPLMLRARVASETETETGS